MTTFSKNPHAEARKKTNGFIFKMSLDNTLNAKFKHKKFSERFAMANYAFLGMGAIAQFASLTTAFTMLSFLFVTIHIIARVICAAALVLAIEAIKRESTNDVMKGIFQYKEVEPFPAVLALVTVAGSIYISVEGAKILPSLFIADVIELPAAIKSDEAIKKDFADRIADKTEQRDTWKEKRLYKGRLAGKDADVIKAYNKDVKELQIQKDAALVLLKKENQKALDIAMKTHEKEKVKIEQSRAELSDQLVYAAIGFEVLFLLSMCFSWWYYTECQKEKEKGQQSEVTPKVTAETPINKSVGTPKVTDKTLEVEGGTPRVTDGTLEVGGNVREPKKIRFIDYEDPKQKVLEVERIEKEYTRICPNCNTPFVHNTHNHKYCQRSCMLQARKNKK